MFFELILTKLSKGQKKKHKNIELQEKLLEEIP